MLTSLPEVARAAHVLMIPPRGEEIADAMAKANQQLDQLQMLADQELPKLRARFSWEAIARMHVKQYSQIISQWVGNSNRADP